MGVSEVRVGHTEGIPIAVVRHQAGASDLSIIVPELCGVVWSSLSAQGVKGGRHVAIYWDDTICLEVGVELTGAISDAGDVVQSTTPAGRTASVVHLGPYQELATAHRAIVDWCAANKLELAGPNWEIYGHWQDAWNTDPSQIRTDVFYQLVP